MFKKALITAVALAMSTGAAHAGEKNELTKQEGVGMLSGAAAGAIVGGPIGAAVGFMFGGILGDSMGTASRAQLHAKQVEEQSKQLEQELIDTRIALAKASERTGGDEMLDALAERLHADVLFRTNDAKMEADVASKLEDLGKLLALHGELEVQLHGFADPRGASEKNLELSLERANAVREALIRGGAAPEQIQLSAHGSDLTTATKGDLEAYAWERRVSLSIRPTATPAVARNE
jgi:outer membrane protein OmpA-like peptidoglycan-associated protein